MFAFERTISRLREMQGAEYWNIRDTDHSSMMPALKLFLFQGEAPVIYWQVGVSQLNRTTGMIFLLLASGASLPNRTMDTIFLSQSTVVLCGQGPPHHISYWEFVNKFTCL